MAGDNNSSCWWKEGTVYQIWPASYRDSNGDGVGDIPGIISTLDYLKDDLGVDIVWLSPMYDSPQVDMGYDVSNYEDIYRPYGTLADMDALIKGLHERGMRLLVDLVINHTSDQHAWFRESRSARNSPKRDWYIWRPAREIDGKRYPPNNWGCAFGGSAWEWDEATQEYYLHLFAKEQPDLNWENPVTRQAIYQSALRFWLDRGVDGFRVDTANMYSKPVHFVDAAEPEGGGGASGGGVHAADDDNPCWPVRVDLWCNGPRIHEFWQEMHAQVLRHYDVMTVGECPATPDPADVLSYVGASQKKMSMLFQFDLADLGQDRARFVSVPWTLPQLKAHQIKWQQFVDGTDGWTTVFMENHDLGRSVSKYTSDDPKHRGSAAKMLAVLQATSTGTLFLYQGQEIGMTNVPRSWPIDEYLDLNSKNAYDSSMKLCGGDPAHMAKVMAFLQRDARDHARTPVQWDDSQHAGFSPAGSLTTKPWMRVNDNYVDINVEQQRHDPHSVLAFWRRMLQLRRQHRRLFVYGRVTAYDMDNPSTFTYTKEHCGRLALVNLNFSAEPQPVANPTGTSALQLLVSSVAEPSIDTLAPFEGRVYLLDSVLPN